MQYNKDVIYTLKVVGTTIINGNQYYLIENEGIKYKVKMLQFQQKLPTPNEVKCFVYGYDADDTPLFAQHKGEISRKLYTIGSTYSFVVHSKPNEQSNHRNFSYGYDMNGIRAFIQVGMGKILTVGRNVRCTVKHINPEGNLYVVPVSQDTDTETNFLTFDELLSNIDVESIPPCLQLETLRLESAEEPKIQQILKQYDNREGEWLLSFLNFLLVRREKKIEEKDWSGVCELITCQRLITEWILEDSLFLTFYSSSVVQSLREKGEHEMLICEAILKAIELIQTDAVNSFLEHIFAKIRTSGYLSDRNRKVELLVALFRLDNTLVDKNLTALTEFCQYVACNIFSTETNTKASVSDLVKKIIEKNKTTCDPSPIKILRLLSASLLLCYDHDAAYTVLVQRIMLYRYASLANPKTAGVLVNKAYDVLTQTNQSYRPEFTWEDIVAFKPESFINKLCSSITGEGDKLIAQHIAKEGSRILLRNGDFALYIGCNPGSLPTCHYKIAEILSIFNGRINIYADKEIKTKLNDRQHIPALKNLWGELYGQLYRQLFSSANIPLDKELPSIGMRLKIRLKAFNPRYPLMMFADVVEPGYEGIGALMASEVTRVHIQSMDGLFYDGDTFEATVQKIDQNGRLRFSINRELFEFVTSSVKFGQHVCAKLFRISKGTCVWICTEGYTLFSPSPSPTPEIGTVALLEVKDINNAGYINASYIEEADESVDETEALAKLVGEYINYCYPQDDQTEEEETNFGQAFNEEDAMLTGEQLSLTLIHELSWLLIAASFSENSLVSRYNLLGTARLLTKMIDDSDLDEYLSLLMNYEENIYSFANDNGQVRWSCTSSIDDSAVARYPSLQPKKELLQILDMFHKHIFNSELAVNIATTKDQNKEHIIRLVLAHSLLSHTLPATALIPLRNELLQRIGASEFVMQDEQSMQQTVPEQKEVLPCLGRESDILEFKSSIVYPAGRTAPDMKYQSEIILRTITGFLNASGGTLCIGVSNEGIANGLKDDYAYMQCNSDGYERFIRQRIIATMGKDVNGIIKMEFPQCGSREICRITIPCYGKLIALEGVVWQRQGNSTMLLDGNALVKQQKRKNDTLQEELNQLSEKNLELVSEGLQQAGGVQTAVAAAFVASLEKRKKKETKKSPKNAIQTSLIRSNPLKSKETDMEVLTYLSLLDNGGYLLEDEYSNVDNAILTLAVKKEETTGSLLLCYENGFINRVPLKILLQKKRNYIYKNGTNKDSRLIFATVENGESGVLVRTARQKNEYLKMFPMTKVKLNMDLTLKGTPLFSYDFGKAIAWEVIPEMESDRLQKLYNENLAHQGYSSTSEAIAKERELLQVMGWEVG